MGMHLRNGVTELRTRLRLQRTSVSEEHARVDATVVTSGPLWLLSNQATQHIDSTTNASRRKPIQGPNHEIHIMFAPSVRCAALGAVHLCSYQCSRRNGYRRRGVNVCGEVAGFYKTTACTDYNILVTTCPVKGFKYVNGSYIKLVVPGSVSTAILGLNDYGDLVGYYSIMQSGCSRPVYHGFIWYHQNVIRRIDAPGTGTCPSSSGGPLTAAMGINKAGTVVGGIWATGQTGTFPNSGWVWVNGTFSTMNPATPGAAAPCCWSVNGISNNGVISGNVFQADFFMAWFKEAKDEDFEDFYEYFPSTQTGGDTYGTGVNSKTDTVGYSPYNGGYLAKQIEANVRNDGHGTENDLRESSLPKRRVHLPIFGE